MLSGQKGMQTLRIARMITFSLTVFLAAALLSGTQQQAKDMHTVFEVSRICGRLVHEELIPIKGSPNSFESKMKSLRKVTVRLYQSQGNTSCCEGLPLVAQERTGWGGSFKFKRMTPGPYWVATRVNGRDYKMQVRFAPRKTDDTLCSNQLFVVDDSGKFQMAITITVE